MNCDRALLSLLDAELPDLAAGTTTLAVHVRGCARCRRVAGQLMADTRHLAGAMPVSVARRRKSTQGYAMAPLALAASLIVLVSIQRRDVAPVTIDTTVLTSVVVEPASPVAPVAPKAAASPARPRFAREFPRAVPVAAVRMDVITEPAVTIPARTVSVTFSAGTRAVVMQTSDPKLVVVWLY